MMPTKDEEDIFCEALEITDPQQRDQFLDQACEAKPSLRQSIDQLLTDHDHATRLFQTVAAEVTLDPDQDPSIEIDRDLGTIIGPYHVLRRLGEGGGGVVYEAQQEAPVHRRVALKILKPGLDHRRVMRRFETERQALELMEHPNIARMLDAGVTSDGRPFFVMELVQGTKIVSHCLQNSLSLVERLQLLQQVCAAVQHAHQKGIIHCDLKPSNILVTMMEGVPVPKVIDFGIAKALASSPSEWTVQGAPVGTPAYMSPEQLNGSRDIDTRSDIYSLGVIMYELLVGRPPFLLEERTGTSSHDLRDRVLHEEPVAPSRVPREGAQSLRWNEDLDWVVMKALEKDRESRYVTVRGLSQDISRYLANEPISARPPSRVYRIRKLIRRNRLASCAIAAGIVILIAGFTTSSLLYLKAQAAELQQSKLRAEAEERERVTRAAILIMQNKIEEADAEIQRMGGMLTQPSVEATNVFHKLATWNALRGNWKPASERLLALSRVNHFDDSDMTDNATRDLIPIGPVLVEAGDLDSLAQFEDVLTQHFGKTNNPIAAEQVLKISLLVPPSHTIMKRLEPLAAVAEKSLPSDVKARLNWLQAWRCFAVGLWHYRIGDIEQSIPFLNRAMSAPRNETVVNSCCMVVRSMALRKLGRASEADADLAVARAQIETKFSTPLEMENQGLWHDWLTARILLREALAGSSVALAPKN